MPLLRPTTPDAPPPGDGVSTTPRTATASIDVEAVVPATAGELPVGAAVPPLDPDVIAAFAQWIDGGAVYRAPRVATP